MRSSILIASLIFGAACFMSCQPHTAFGQDAKTVVKVKPPVVVKYVKPTRAKTKINRRNFAGAKNKRKKIASRRKVDLSKVPRVIRVIKQP